MDTSAHTEDGKVYTSVRLDESDRTALSRLADENDRSLSAEIRRAVRAYLEANEVAA